MTPRKDTSLLHKDSQSSPVMSNSLWTYGLYSPWNSPGQDTGMGSLPLLQRVFSTQGLNPGLPHYRQILYQLSHKGDPRILEWVTYPVSSRFANPGIEPGSPALQADSVPTELWGNPPQKAHYIVLKPIKAYYLDLKPLPIPGLHFDLF